MTSLLQHRLCLIGWYDSMQFQPELVVTFQSHRDVQNDGVVGSPTDRSISIDVEPVLIGSGRPRRSMAAGSRQIRSDPAQRRRRRR